MYALYKAKQITKAEFYEFDDLHYRIENQLLKLIEQVQNKRSRGGWMDSFIT